VRRAAKISLGGPDDEMAETGPLISQAHLNNVSAYVQRGIAEGATLLVGGKRSEKPEHAKGWYYLPTVLDNCQGKMYCVQEESFGPVMTVEVFDSEAEAIAIGNDTVFGLSGGVWSGDAAKAARVASALRHGTIWVNDFGPYRPAAEWGGYKQSGIGRELGEHGLGEYLEIKHIWTNNAPSRSGWFKDQ
jgi:betaine-aldehyde dehydrogenase